MKREWVKGELGDSPECSMAHAEQRLHAVISSLPSPLHVDRCFSDDSLRHSVSLVFNSRSVFNILKVTSENANFFSTLESTLDNLNSTQPSVAGRSGLHANSQLPYSATRWRRRCYDILR